MLSMRNEFRKTQRGNAISEELKLPITHARFQPELARNTLQLNRGDNTYAEIAQLSGLQASEWTWASRFLDVDLDGHQDLIVTTGNESDVLDADMLNIVANSPKTQESHFQNMMRFPRLETPNLIFRNGGDLRFAETSNEWGFSQVGISNGMAAGDLDNDGDLDLVINNLNAAAFLLENIGSASRIAFRLKGKSPNSAGVGATVELITGKIHQKQTVIAGGRYLSGDQPLCVFGIPDASSGLSAVIKWPDGSFTTINNLVPNTVYEISQATAEARQHSNPIRPRPLFRDASNRLNALHSENPRIDFAKSTATTGLAELGPGVCVVDVNGDGFDELFVGNGKGGMIADLQLHQTAQQQSGTVTRLDWGESVKLIRDTATILAQEVGGSGLALLVALSNYEDGLTVGSALNAVSQKNRRQLLPASLDSIGPVSMADIDGDGQLDLFAGGRARRNDPYLSVGSALHIGTGGGFNSGAKAGVLAGIGPVSGSVFSDIDNDGDPDLILARHWNCPMVLLNVKGRLVDATEKWGLSDFHGLWNGVTTGDFNNDGWMDLLMTNMGRNSRYTEHLPREVWLHVADFNQDGLVDGIESVYDTHLAKRVPVLARQNLAALLPWVTGLFQSHRAFAKADIAMLLESSEVPHAIRKLNTLDTTVFLNNGVSFKKTKLPVEAQFAPAFGCSVADFDGDGNEDAYLAQNFFNVDFEASRHDAGLGLVLLGDGLGGFRALSRAASGVANLGQARGCAVSDLDGDGRVDLVTAQNNDQLKLHFNATGKAGLRVELVGGNDNPQAVGASVRLEKAGELRAKRELRLGSGYWSQDSLVQVFADVGASSKLHIAWPDRTVAVVRIPDDAKSIKISKPDEVRIVH
ncbi:MAG: FG-GAP-like repeat-containing protein [Verrucomicrobiota bacterium]|nr:FG-GAP-like repeat-containing protein [Verrucomicrobiota bacterium]